MEGYPSAPGGRPTPTPCPGTLRGLLCPHPGGGSGVRLLPWTGEVGIVWFTKDWFHPCCPWFRLFPSVPGTVCHVCNKGRVCRCHGAVLRVTAGEPRLQNEAAPGPGGDDCPVLSGCQVWGEGHPHRITAGRPEMSQGVGPVLPLTGCGTLGSDASL